MSSHSIVRSVVAALISAPLLLSTTNAQSLTAQSTPALQASATGPASELTFVWTLHVGGVSLGTIGYKSRFVGETYSSVSKLKTSGIVNSFYAAVIEAGSSGWVRGAMLAPVQYDSNYEGEKATQRVALAYTPAGINLVADPMYDVRRFPVSEEQKKGTLDPLSGITFALSGITVTPDKPCGDTIPIFDGRRRYDIALTYVGQDTISSGQGGYSGPVTECRIAYNQVAGFKPNLNRGKSLPQITAYVARVSTTGGGPIKHFYVPVRIESETPFGMAVANARNIQVDGGGT